MTSDTGTTQIPFAKFHEWNTCLMHPEGCEGVEWIREEFGDPVPITQRFIRQAALRYRGINTCAYLDQYVPEHLKANHDAYVQRIKAEYREAIQEAEVTMLQTGDVAAYDQAVSIAFLRSRGSRWGALEGAFTPRFDPYY